MAADVVSSGCTNVRSVPLEILNSHWHRHRSQLVVRAHLSFSKSPFLFVFSGLKSPFLIAFSGKLSDLDEFFQIFQLPNSINTHVIFCGEMQFLSLKFWEIFLAKCSDFDTNFTIQRGKQAIFFFLFQFLQLQSLLYAFLLKKPAILNCCLLKHSFRFLD